MNAVERVLEYTELETEEDHKKYPQSIETHYDKGNINFDGVYLGYHLDSRVVIGTQSDITLHSGIMISVTLCVMILMYVLNCDTVWHDMS